MANQKRARQDQNRSQKLAQAAVEQKKVQTSQQRNKVLKIVAVIVAIVAVVLLWNQFISTDSGSSVDTAVAPTTTAGNVTTTTVAQFASPKLNTKPVITVSAGLAPTKLEIKDLEVGTGTLVEAGDTVFVQYAGNGWATKKEFDSSWSRGAQPFEVTNVGKAPVIDGWNQGLIGMKVGGRRQLIIPPSLGYGDQAQGENIKANDTLVFVIDAVRVIKAADVVSNTPTIAQ